MGEVYRARDTRLDRSVAIKIVTDESLKQRFDREAKTISSLNHPNPIGSVGAILREVSSTCLQHIDEPVSTAIAARVHAMGIGGEFERMIARESRRGTPAAVY